MAVRDLAKSLSGNSEIRTASGKPGAVQLLRQHGFQLSMSGKGNCYDESAVETFFKTIKAELIWRKSWQTLVFDPKV